MLTRFFKGLCLAVFVLGLLDWAGALPAGMTLALPLTWARIALALLLIHVAELAFAYKYLRRYPGSLATSLALTLLFGLLHWKPLADVAKAAQVRKSP